MARTKKIKTINPQECACCHLQRQTLKDIKLMHSIKAICKDCQEEIKWTNKILKIGTDWILQKFPKKYIRFNQFSVIEL
jgi:hypothetical protein